MMSVGITSWGAYLPRYRLARSLVDKAWGRKERPGERCVANFDEDALTMAVEAAERCREGLTGEVGGLFLASTTFPYAEKQCAAMAATACDLPRMCRTADFSGSVRAGATALRAALDAVAAGSAAHMIVAAADVRLGEPRSEMEVALGDGAAAVAVGREGLRAVLVGAASVGEEFTHFWRTAGERYVQAAEGRFPVSHGYLRDVREAVAAVLQESSVEPAEVAACALFAPDQRAGVDLARRMGLAPDRIDLSYHNRVGNLGAADMLFGLGRVLERVEPGSLVLAVGYGEGADALLFRTTELGARGLGPSDALLGDGVPLPSYERYLSYRRILPGEFPVDVVTPMMEYKELRQDLRLYGSRCATCGLVQYPMARVCIGCRSRGPLGEHKLGRRGTIFTYTIDHLAASFESPLPMVVVDLEGGGRLYLQMTEAGSEQVGVGRAVELTFRRLNEGGGNINYFWKARPPRARPVPSAS